MFKKFFRWIKRMFTPAYKPSVKYNDYGEGEQFNKRYGFIIPHTSKAQGEESEDGITEYMYASKMLSAMNFPSESRNNGGVKGAAKRLAKIGCNVSIEPHLNSYNKDVFGFEVLYLKGDEKSKLEARDIVSYFSVYRRMDLLKPSANRGVKALSKGDRGYYNLVRAKKAGMEIAVLTELFFLDNPNDYVKIEDMRKFWINYLNARKS